MENILNMVDNCESIGESSSLTLYWLGLKVSCMNKGIQQYEMENYYIKVSSTK